MKLSESISNHTFHIPVMGTGFTMDTPLRVARYGINSVVSMGDDRLMERLRKYYSEKYGVPYTPIALHEEDARARRVTAWMDFMADQVELQSQALRQSPLEPGSELNRYFELLPEGELKSLWKSTVAMPQGAAREEAVNELRRHARPGTIDVNIMTKVDRSIMPNGQPLASDSTDALSGLRGYSKSKVSSTVTFSAGMNPRLYGYLTAFDDYFPDAQGNFKKRVLLKVSDWRSAEIQARFLAKKGIWVSEFRVESGLNCGGHAFAAQGRLMGPILEEFNSNLDSLGAELYQAWIKGVAAKGFTPTSTPPPILLSVQGGVGTWDEHQQIMKKYNAHSVGWGSPFLLVPEATLVDDDTRYRLAVAEEEDVQLSDASPLGIAFWSLKTSSSEEKRRERIAEDKPGSPCPHSYLTFNTEFGKTPLCTASRAYQRKKLEVIEKSGIVGEALAKTIELAKSKACICVDLGGSALKALGIDNKALVSVCPGPNIVWFERVSSLEEMVGHIYGRNNLLSPQSLDRPHMFLNELKLTVDYMLRELHRHTLGLAPKGEGYFKEYGENLIHGLEYYKERSELIFGKSRDWLEEMTADLQREVEALTSANVLVATS